MLKLLSLTWVEVCYKLESREMCEFTTLPGCFFILQTKRVRQDRGYIRDGVNVRLFLIVFSLFTLIMQRRTM